MSLQDRKRARVVPEMREQSGELTQRGKGLWGNQDLFPLSDRGICDTPASRSHPIRTPNLYLSLAWSQAVSEVASHSPWTLDNICTINV